ncbi:hypothetical protein HOE41_01415 [Candidatus Woesearchaeota archaeon]|nr:hypothetical protein [Candidatus Woesearchaeota archaeon]
MDESHIYWLSDLSIGDVDRFGEKAAYLAELHNKKIPIPNAFVISSDFFDGVLARFRPELQEALANVSDLQSAYNAAAQARNILDKFTINESGTELLLNTYKKLPDYVEHENMSALTKQLVSSGRDLPFVAVRASPTRSSPFQFKPVLNAYGIEQLTDSIKKVIMSAFSPQAIYYRYKHGIEQLDISMSIIVQKMAQAVKSGDMFSINPIKNSKSELYAQAIWGINLDMLTNPSTFVFNKMDKTILEKNVVKQEKYYTRNAQFGELLLEPLPEHMRSITLLNERELSILADIATRIEQIMNFPQHIEWAIERNSVQILQTRPITRILEKPLLTTESGVLINTLTSSGKAVVVFSKQDLQKINAEAVMVATDASRELFPYIVQSAAVINRARGLTSPAAQICRDFSIPALFQAEIIDRISEGQDIQFTGQNVELVQSVAAAPIPSYGEYSSQNTPTQDIAEPTTSTNGDISSIKTQFEHLERALTEQVSREAQRRASGEHLAEEDFKRSQLISELEWQVRNLRIKLETS